MQNALKYSIEIYLSQASETLTSGTHESLDLYQPATIISQRYDDKFEEESLYSLAC